MQKCHITTIEDDVEKEDDDNDKDEATGGFEKKGILFCPDTITCQYENFSFVFVTLLSRRFEDKEEMERVKRYISCSV